MLCLLRALGMELTAWGGDAEPSPSSPPPPAPPPCHHCAKFLQADYASGAQPALNPGSSFSQMIAFLLYPLVCNYSLHSYIFFHSFLFLSAFLSQCIPNCEHFLFLLFFFLSSSSFSSSSLFFLAILGK